MIQKIRESSTKEYKDGLNTIPNIFTLAIDQSPNCMNVKFNDGSLTKIYGTKTMNSVLTANTGGWGSFDFGAGSARNLIVGAGTGIFSSTNLGATFTAIHTSRTAGRMYFERVKQYLISTTDNYDAPYYWAGTAGTQMILLSTAATACKFSIEYQGFIIFVNSQADKRQVIYQDANSMINGTYDNSFSLPSSKDDEACAVVLYRRLLYIITRYKIFRISYVGGNPDFDYKEVKNFGAVPGTVKIINYKNYGEVIAMLCWDKRVRIFDGSSDEIISDNIENDNGISEFALSKITDSQMTKSFAEMDTNENFYKLCVAISPSNIITHMACLNLKTGGWYPYRYGRDFLSMCMAESANKQYLMGFDYQGYCHMMDSGNTIINTGVNDWYDSPFLFNKTPNVVSKQKKMFLYFKETSSGTIQYQDAINFKSSFSTRDTIILTEANSVNQIEKTIDVPVTCNVYQYKLTSDSNKADPWTLNRTDLSSMDMGVGKG